MSATTIPETTETPAQQAPAQTETKPNGTPNFSDRVKTDPDFAWGTVQNLQRKVTELTNRVKPLETLEGVAKATFGDVSTGVTQIVSLADKAYRIEQNPEWKRTVDELLNGKRPAAPAAAESEEYLTPEEKKIAALEAQLGELRNQFVQTDTRVARSELQGHLEGFFQSELGRALEPSERESVVAALQTQFQTWGRTAEGRRVLSNLAPNTIRTVVLSHLDERGELPNVYERMRVAAQQKLSGAETDSPSLSSRRVNDDLPEVKNAKDALHIASQKWIPAEDRQKLGSGW